jgi:D-glycero-alpha-D-manno-heptose 1-phosphate guanylyltransferase
MKIKEAIILAGGLGTRLRAAVPDLPKCMAVVAGKPFLHYVINHFIKEGIEKLIFSLGYKHEVIEAYLNKEYSTINIQYSIEEEPLGTGGAIKLACEKATEENVLVLNGDTAFNIKLNKLAPFHYMAGADCTLSLKPMKNLIVMVWLN